MDFDKMSKDEIEEVANRSTELRCSMEVAWYIIALEKRIDRLEDKQSALWEDYQQR